MNVRSLILKIHLWMGLAAAVFLTILGGTGSVIAFENDIDRWARPGLWYVQVGSRTLPEGQLIQIAQQRFAPARAVAVEISRQHNLAQVLDMSDEARVFINPYNGEIRGRTVGPSPVEKTLGYLHQIHLRLVPDPRSAPKLAAIGKIVVSYAGLVLCLMVPTGLILWWRTKRASIQWSGSWFRILFDVHHVTGVAASLFLFIAAFTGVLIGFDWGEKSIYAVTRSSRPPFELPPSTATAGPQVPIDQAMAAAEKAIPDATVAGILLPEDAKGAINFLMRVPEETSESVHSIVSIDQYSGNVVMVRDFRTDSEGYRWIRFNRSIHTGDVLGTPTHIVMSLCSLALVVMVITGLVIWWKKLNLAI